MVSTDKAKTGVIYPDRPNRSPRMTWWSVVRVILHHGEEVMETHAILDECSERSIILLAVA
jgi:hypothetical protein